MEKCLHIFLMLPNDTLSTKFRKFFRKQSVSLKYKWVENFSKDIVGSIFGIELEIVPTIWSEKYPVY